MLVWLRYAMPLICACTMIITCALPLFRLANDDTEKVSQSVFTLAASSMSSSKSTAAKDGLSDVDYALAKSLKVGVVVFRIVLVLIVFLTLWFTLTTLCALLCPPESLAANRWRVTFKLFVLGPLEEFFLCWANLLPLCLPYYVINRFSKYYIVKEITSTTAEYYEYAVYTDGLNPLWLMFGLALFASVLFVVTRDWAGMYGMDMYRYYTPDEKTKCTK